MQNEFYERLMQIMSYLEIASLRSFSKKIGISFSKLQSYQRGSIPSVEVVNKILSNINEISIEWLVTGNGKMLKEPGSLLPDDQQHLFDICEELKKRCEKMKGELEEKDQVIKNLVKTNLLLVEAKNGEVVRQGNDAECADVG